jgi:hypothetical protein
MGAAQGDFAGAEIVEQGSGALYLRQVEFACSRWAQVATLLRLNGMTGEFHEFLVSPAMGGAAGARIIIGESRRGVYVFLLCGDAKLNFDTAAVESFSLSARKSDLGSESKRLIATVNDLHNRHTASFCNFPSMCASG